jgi:hypothetical protein
MDGKIMKIHKSIYKTKRFNDDTAKCGFYDYPLDQQKRKIILSWKKVTCKNCKKEKGRKKQPRKSRDAIEALQKIVNISKELYQICLFMETK